MGVSLFCRCHTLQLVVEYRRIRFSLLGTWHGIGNSHSPTPTIYYVIVRTQRGPGTSFSGVFVILFPLLRVCHRPSKTSTRTRNEFFRCFRNTLSQAALIFLTDSTRYGKISSDDLSAETRLSQVTGRMGGEDTRKGGKRGEREGEKKNRDGL